MVGERIDEYYEGPDNQRIFIDVSTIPVDPVKLMQEIERQKEIDQERWTGLKARLNGQSDSTMKQLGQLVLPHWDRGDRNMILTEAA